MSTEWIDGLPFQTATDNATELALASAIAQISKLAEECRQGFERCKKAKLDVYRDIFDIKRRCYEDCIKIIEKEVNSDNGISTDI